ncbi:hypothetical protein PsorP6_004321 [Peronosclerospora sorghi]|uniref:Uncharacterized protein n=1 Tax=Peronosclerospora sorghi TaxID=230839 RepID=A0ACC0VLF0_9STRA|nr:hypothetical protein PsorP6_004321 [Peronosclerospora sorghi]
MSNEGLESLRSVVAEAVVAVVRTTELKDLRCRKEEGGLLPASTSPWQVVQAYKSLKRMLLGSVEQLVVKYYNFRSGNSKSRKLERRRVAMANVYGFFCVFFCLACAILFNKLKKSLEMRSEAVQQRTEMLRSILTPEQSLTYLRWVDANQDRLPDFLDKTLLKSGTSMLCVPF